MKNLIDIHGKITQKDSSELTDKEYNDFIADFLEVVYNKGYKFSGGFEHLTTEEHLNTMKLNVAFPIKKAYSSERYELMILDANNVTHYWNFDGSYDGMSSDCNIDPQTGTCLN